MADVDYFVVMAAYEFISLVYSLCMSSHDHLVTIDKSC
jgi:hypothetical protein